MKKTLSIALLTAAILGGCQKKDNPTPNPSTPNPEEEKIYSFQIYQDVKTYEKIISLIDAGKINQDSMLGTTFIFRYSKSPQDSVLWGCHLEGDGVMFGDTLGKYYTLFVPAELNWYNGPNDWLKTTWVVAPPVPEDSAAFLKAEYGWSSYVNASSPNDPYPATNIGKYTLKKMPDKYYNSYQPFLPAAWKNLTDSLYANPTKK